MDLNVCPECGVVVDFDKMKTISDEYEKGLEDKKKVGYMCSGDHETGFFCPCCKKWVYVYLD